MLQGMKEQANQSEGQQQQFNTMYMYRHENVRLNIVKCFLFVRVIPDTNPIRNPLTLTEILTVTHSL